LLTVDFGRFTVGKGNRVLDFGCGAGRHAFEAYRRGADVVALDADSSVLKDVRDMFVAMAEAGEAPAAARAAAVCGDGMSLPFPDGSFDRIVAAEVMEHLPQDKVVLAELMRVLAPGGLLAVTVPRWLPERVCWSLSAAYHQVEGGHVRIYRRGGLLGMLRDVGLRPLRTHYAHALHSPYWWLKCATGLDDSSKLVGLYHDFLVWDIMKRPHLTRIAERLLDPLIGKSLVVYAGKP
jgi:SAM-dependent methyltransferase